MESRVELPKKSLWKLVPMPMQMLAVSVVCQAWAGSGPPRRMGENSLLQRHWLCIIRKPLYRQPSKRLVVILTNILICWRGCLIMSNHSKISINWWPLTVPLWFLSSKSLWGPNWLIDINYNLQLWMKRVWDAIRPQRASMLSQKSLRAVSSPLCKFLGNPSSSFIFWTSLKGWPWEL